MFSRLPGKVYRCDVDFVKRKQKLKFPAKRECCVHAYGTKIISVTDIALVNLSKCFLGNRENFFPNEQALSIKFKVLVDRQQQDLIIKLHDILELLIYGDVHLCARTSRANEMTQ